MAENDYTRVAQSIDSSRILSLCMYTRDTCQVFKFIEMFQENRFSCRETVPYKQFENLEDDQKSKFHVDEKDVDEVLDATDTSAIIPQNSGQQRIYSKR